MDTTINKLINECKHKAEKYYGGHYDMASYFNIYDNFTDHAEDIFTAHVSYVWLKTWYCTDTWVGLKAIFYDGKVVCLTYQPGRKYSTEFFWVSKKAEDKMIKLINSISLKETEDNRTYLDLKTPISEFVKKLDGLSWEE